MTFRRPRRVVALLSLMAIMGALAITAPVLSAASAQARVVPTMSLTAEASDDGTESTVTITIDPGSDVVAAMEGSLTYDPDRAAPVSCDDFNAFGSCNSKSAGVIQFAVAASAGGWTEVSDVLTLTLTVDDVSDVDVAVSALYPPTGGTIDDASTEASVTIGDDAASVDTETASSDPIAGSGALSGTILVGDSPLFGVAVCAESNQTGRAVCGDADSRGTYRIDGLPTGTYAVTASHYTDDAGELSLSSVAVISPNVTTGVDGTLSDDAEDAPGIDSPDGPASDPRAEEATSASTGNNSIAGTVTTAAGQAVPAAIVCIEDVAIGRPACAGTGFDGTYLIDDLLGGNYVVTFTDPGGRYADQTGPRFGLNTDEHRTGIDFTATPG